MLVIAGKVGWSVLSDARIKNTINEDVKGLDFILKLRPVTYHISNAAITAVTGSKETPDFPGKYDGEKVKYSGFIAQEVEQAAKAANYEFSGYDIPKNERGLYTIKYAEFVVPLVKGMQEQQQMIVELKQSKDDLNKTIEQLLIRIENLEAK
ncbi:MAG: tail fiber domain-containing protein [Bacteroidota bacterium]